MVTNVWNSFCHHLLVATTHVYSLFATFVVHYVRVLLAAVIPDFFFVHCAGVVCVWRQMEDVDGVCLTSLALQMIHSAPVVAPQEEQ